METQLAIDLSPLTTPQSAPVKLLHVCPVRDRCLLDILTNSAGYRCGYEQVGTVEACLKKRRLEGR